MSEQDFAGRVAVVTGAGRGIGREYAHFLAARGAAVVVNDLGGSMDGSGSDERPAHAVVREITEAGGRAVADVSDISTVAGGAHAVDTAVENFGRIDIVVNNAGNVRFGGLPDVDAANIETHLAVHVMGAFNTIHAAWPHMIEQDYGRVVITSSIGMFGLPDNTGYATAKAAVLGMANSMTLSAGDHDLTINVIAPNAMTRMGGAPSEGMDEMRSRDTAPTSDMDPRFVAPMMGYLAHESCTVSGEAFLAGGKRFAHAFIGVTSGWLPDDPAAVEVADVADHLSQIKDQTDYYVPRSLMECVGTYLSHQGRLS